MTGTPVPHLRATVRDISGSNTMIDDRYDDDDVFGMDEPETGSQDAAQSGTAIDLSVFDEEFENAPVEKKDFETVPDGKYQVSVERAEITTANSGAPMLKWTLRIIAPNYIGRKLWRYNLMASAENIKWLKNDLYTCGLKIKKASDLAANLEKLLDIKIEISLRNSGDFQNIYFNRLIDGGAGASDGAPDEIDHEMNRQAKSIFS